MKWVTRERPKTDRIACPWLIRRFIDPEAEIVFVPSEKVLAVAQEMGGHAFDAPGAQYTHRTDSNGHEQCTFETLLDDYGLGDNPALTRLAKIVHAADISADLSSDPAGAGLLAIGLGGLDVEDNDLILLDRATFVYDALYAWCEGHVQQAVHSLSR
jgi:hypothetical protein